MSVEIIVPALGESVSEATIAKWYKKVGDPVKVDELLLELETEKVTLEVNATTEGVIESISGNEGDNVAVGDVVGIIKAGAVASTTTSDSKATEAKPAVPAATPPPASPSGSGKGVPSTLPPSVQKIVAENNLDPTKITGTGKDGRITKEDALKAVNAPADTSKPATISQYSESFSGDDKPIERVRMSRLRKTIAARLKESQNTAAILSTFNEIDMTNVLNFRKKHREEFEKKHGIKLGFMSFFVKAVVGALQEVPSVNAEMDGDDIIYKHYYDIGVAVGTEQGLVVPVVKGCDKLSFAGIEKEIVSLATKAREGTLAMSDLTGGTFSITNGGVYGSLLSTPIINPPQTGIIGLHSTQQRPVAVDGKVEIRPMMYVALSYDHRIIDGKDAVTFLVKVKQAIEDPERILFGM
ncbi:MAG: 2-oxoglutarate dehydrogenase complex dihydrolipoyllysine-residue succinyltransferase [Rickettsiaceae bacterium]|nr:2-oxoglutarate dehydrogenase complex dihydrolipoyllysine-residue succinyltransferase [Rickettsiaceae bacterium]